MMNNNDKRTLIIGYVNLKEHFEALWIEREKRLNDRFLANTKTLEATAIVLEHRLEVLNHAHEQSLEDRADFVRLSEYRNTMKELDTWKTNVNRNLVATRTRSVTWMTAIGVFFVVIQIVLKFWKG